MKILFAIVGVLLVTATSCSTHRESGGGFMSSKRNADAACSSEETIGVLLNQNVYPTIPVYVGTDPRTYRITGVVGDLTGSQDLPVNVILDGNAPTPTTVTFSALVANGGPSGVSPNSIDVEGQKIELNFKPVPGGYSNKFVQFCFRRIQ